MKRVFFTFLFIASFQMGFAQEIPKLQYSNMLISLEGQQEVLKDIRFDLPAQKEDGSKSIGLALFYSLLLPGAGEYYLGEYNQAKMFAGAELLIWGGYLLNYSYYKSQLKDNQTFARTHAGIKHKGGDTQYWIDVGKFNDIYAYNAQRDKDRRFDDKYTETAQNFWQWDSKENRLKYDSRRLDNVVIKERETYFFTALILNHLISGINAMRIARKQSKMLAEYGVDYQFIASQYDSYNPYFGLKISKQF